MAKQLNEIYNSDATLYLYSADMTFVLDGETYAIETSNITSIIVDHDYVHNNMPMIFCSVTISSELLDLMLENQNTGLVIFNLRRAVANSDMPDLFTDYITDEFIYFITDSSSEMMNEGRTYKQTTIGLLSRKCINKNKKLINGVVSGNLTSLMYYVTGHMPVVIEPPTKNIVFENRILPPMNSISKMLSYINSLNVFYDTPYRFYIDFDCAYLLSSSGKAVKKDGEKISTILLNCKNEYDIAVQSKGMYIDESKSLLEIIIDEEDYEIADDHILEKSYSKVTAANASGKVSSKSINVLDHSNIVEKTRSIRVMNDNDGLLDNIIASANQSTVKIMVQKEFIDSSDLTLNKEYVVKMDEIYNYEDYNGRYLLTRKRDIFIRTDDQFTSTTMLMLDKVYE